MCRIITICRLLAHLVLASLVLCQNGLFQALLQWKFGHLGRGHLKIFVHDFHSNYNPEFCPKYDCSVVCTTNLCTGLGHFRAFDKNGKTESSSVKILWPDARGFSLTLFLSTEPGNHFAWVFEDFSWVFAKICWSFFQVAWVFLENPFSVYILEGYLLLFSATATDKEEW